MPQLARTGPGGPPLEPQSVPRRTMERSFINSVINRPGISLFYVILPEKSRLVIFSVPNAPFRSNMLASRMNQLARTGPGRPPLEPLSVPRRAMECSFINNVINRHGFSLFYVILPKKSRLVIFSVPNAPFRSNMLASQCLSSRIRVRDDPLSTP